MPRRPASPAAAALGRQIRARRQALKWSMEELAHRSEISRYHLNLIELGRADPAFSVAVRIAVALGCQIADLYPS